MYDAIIIGAGVTGLGTAWYLTEFLKKKVLLLEQFPFPNQFGSSAGHSRITRELYPQYYYCVMMKEAHKMWRDLEQKTNSKLYIQNSLLSYLEPHSVKLYRDSIQKSKISVREITSEECNNTYPLFSVPSTSLMLLDPNAGVLRSDRCLQALMTQSLKFGLEFHEMEKVVDIVSLNRDEVKVTTEIAEYYGRSVIVCTGTWSQKLCSRLGYQLPLEAHKIHFAYFRPKKDSNVKFNYETIPSFFDPDSHIYGMCGTEFPNCLKIGNFISEKIDPDMRDSTGNNCTSIEKFLQLSKKFLKERIPSTDLNPVHIYTCIITRTPDELPIIDKLGQYGNIIVGVGFNGSGFKTGVIHGKLLAELAVKLKPSYSLEMFSSNRFKCSSSSVLKNIALQKARL